MPKFKKISSLFSKTPHNTWKPKKTIVRPKVAKPKVVSKTRNYTYGENWNKFSKDLKKLDGDVCSIKGCRSTDRLESHHIVPLSDGGKNCRANIVTLCYIHHDLKHSLTKKRRRK